MAEIKNEKLVVQKLSVNEFADLEIQFNKDYNLKVLSFFSKNSKDDSGNFHENWIIMHDTSDKSSKTKYLAGYSSGLESGVIN